MKKGGGVKGARGETRRPETASGDLEKGVAYQGQRVFSGHRDGKKAAGDEKVLGAKDQFAMELDHFARCIQENLRPRTPGEEGLQDQVLMEAIYEAARTGVPVKVGPPAGAGSGLDVTRGPEPEEPG